MAQACGGLGTDASGSNIPFGVTPVFMERTTPLKNGIKPNAQFTEAFSIGSVADQTWQP
jgi:hypothetical protein